MNSHDDPPLDSFGIGQQPQEPNPAARQCREMADLVSAVVALDHSRPVSPRPASLQAIFGKIALTAPVPVRQRWIAWSGWAAAAAVAMFFLSQKQPGAKHPVAETSHGQGEAPHILAHAQPVQPDRAQAPENPPGGGAERIHADEAARETVIIRDRQRSLVQEIDTLRKEVARLASRDKERLMVRDGVSWPIIMKLTAPGTDPDAAIVRNNLLGPMLEAGALADASPVSGQNARTNAKTPPVTPDPSLASAVPIYDPARDSGQLVISNLEAPEEGQAYFLWVQSDKADEPVLVGSLPENFASSETFDFQLGSVGVIPDRFLITQDAQLAPGAPNRTNTVLLGPENREK